MPYLYRLLLILFMSICSSTSYALNNFNDIFKSHHAVMLLIDPATGEIVDANSAALDFYGLTLSDLKRIKIQDINMLSPEQVKQERLLAKLENRNFFTFRHQVANEQIKTVKVYSSPISQNGRALLYSIVFDISEQRSNQRDIWHYQSQLEEMVDAQVAKLSRGKAQVITILSVSVTLLLIFSLFLVYLLFHKTKAERKASRLSQMVEQSPLAMAILDEGLHVLYANNKFQQSREHLEPIPGTKCENYLSISCLPEEQVHAISRSLLTQNQWIGEVEYKNHSSELVSERANVYMLNEANNLAAKHYVVMIEDITEQKRHEKELRLAAAVLETATEAVMICDKELNITAVNKAFTEITGYTEAEALGKSPDEVNAANEDEFFYAQTMQSIKHGGYWQGEVCNRNKVGNIYYEWLTISAQLDKSGELEAYVSLFSDITKKKQAETKIFTQANYDNLTGLANRNLFTNRFEHTLELAEREHTKVALLYIDLDGFKHINDSLGHSAGDLLLQEASKRLTGCVRKSDTITRLGGDEFAIIMAGNETIYSVESVANNILNLMSQPYSLKGKMGYVTASIGVTFYPDDGNDTESLLRKADSAMYKAKENGRNNFQFFTSEMEAIAQQRRELEIQLRKAIDNNALYIEFQPIHCTESNKIKSAEALVRWEHPELGYIPPNKFIALAEEIGLIHQLGEWILRESCASAKQWIEQFDDAPNIAVNISSLQFQKSNWIETVSDILDVTQFPAEKLTLEITEGLLIEEDSKTEQQLNQLKDLGIHLSIDDFGTGYSSLSYLKRFPIDTLKIDKSFISELSKGEEDEALVNAIIALAHNLGLKIIAEGVELEEQKQWLSKNKCQYIQGFLYSPSLKNQAFMAYCQTHL